MPISEEPTSGLEPLTCSLRVSLFPTQNSLEMAVLQALLALLCPPRIRKCRQISPLLLTLTNVSIPRPPVVKSSQSALILGVYSAGFGPTTGGLELRGESFQLVPECCGTRL